MIISIFIQKRPAPECKEQAQSLLFYLVSFAAENIRLHTAYQKDVKKLFGRVWGFVLFVSVNC